MNKKSSPDYQETRKEWECIKSLWKIFGTTRSHDECVKVSKRLLLSGTTPTVMKNLEERAKNLNPSDKEFFSQMNERGFAIEQLFAFLAAPEVEKSFADKTRSEIKKDIQKEWKTIPKKIVSGTLSRSSSIGSFVVLMGAGIAIGVPIVGAFVDDPVSWGQTIEILTGKLSGSTQMLTSLSLGQQVGGAIVAGYMLKTSFGIVKKTVESAVATKKAKDVSLSNLLAESLPSEVGQDLIDYEKTKRLVKDIPKPFQNLLTHLYGHELRIFLHGDDELRREMLTARPPSYGQRVACLNAIDQNIVMKWRSQFVLAGSDWSGELSQSPASMKKALLAMRSRNETSENFTQPSGALSLS